MGTQGKALSKSPGARPGTHRSTYCHLLLWTHLGTHTHTHTRAHAHTHTTVYSPKTTKQLKIANLPVSPTHWVND